ncbi:tetratricopeptide repeat protein [Paenibacillus dakarensis]|uniref:tetratricopeptide repeat protein n=1 Tax=Paenibacillus dakarensis TaxID=1527293 RepID=UPI0006D55597|nr:tetratricopeptide repeat protein [Paenibacillus dakarensis]
MTDLINREPEHNPEPPKHPFELGKWHESRGHFEEALECFKQGAINAIPSDSSSGSDNQNSALSWIEYGRLSTKLNKFEEASSSFRQALTFGLPYTSLALAEWTAMLYKQGLQDSDIFHILIEELPSHFISPSVLGCALTNIGAYKEAIQCFNMTKFIDNKSAMMHARCLINEGNLHEAVEMLNRLNHTFNPLDWLSDEDRSIIQHTLLLCEWRISGSRPNLKSSGYNLSKLARAALNLGMVAEAENILSSEGVAGEHTLIFLLYSEGYIDLAITWLCQLSDSEAKSSELQFIEAEQLYDEGNYEKASALFEKIRLAQPEHTNARFGEAACYLQSALLSLSSRITRIDTQASVKQQAIEYMKGINAALHIVENTKWHTVWTLEQQRRRSTIKQTTLLN